MRERLTYANVMVTILAVVGIGGGTVAVASTDNSQDRAIAKAVVKARLDGLSVRKVFFKDDPSTTPKTVLNVAGLKLKVGCDSNAVPVATVTSATDAVELQGHSVGDVGAGTPQVYTASNASQVSNQDILGGSDFGSGVLNYSTFGGRIVTMVYGFDYGATFGSHTVCTFWGTVITG